MVLRARSHLGGQALQKVAGKPHLRQVKLHLWNSPEWRDHEIVSGETGGRAPFFSRLGYGGKPQP